MTDSVLADEYLAPDGDKVSLNFRAPAVFPYAPPSGDQVAIEFVPQDGEPPVVQTQYIHPSGVGQPFVGVPGVRLAVLIASLNGRGIASAIAYGKPTVYNRNTYARPTGFAVDRYGVQRVEFYRRFLLPLAPAVAVTGIPRLELSDRYVTPASIYREFPSAHTVGGLRYLRPVGYVATLFGTRVVPEIQQLYPAGFAGSYGTPKVENYRQVLRPAGFATSGGQEALRWGVARAWNLRQYVELTYDPDSELNPPGWSLWTSVVNRNRVIGTIGQAMARHGDTAIYNNARALAPGGIAEPSMPPEYKAGMVAGAVRSVPLEGIESPYISTWLSVVNDARVIRPSGYKSELFGVASLLNTRRTFRFAGWDSAWFGYPMVAFGVRTINLANQGVAAERIQLPGVKLFKQFVDPIGSDMARIGTSNLSIHRNMLYPRWLHRDDFGEPRVRNLTPELATRGRNAEEFGECAVRLQWREVVTHETFTQIIPRPGIAYRDRRLQMVGIKAWTVSDKLVVTRTGAPPYTEQTISLRGAVDPLTGREADGYGIEVDPELQVPEPNLNQCVLYAESPEVMTAWGSARVTSNVIRITYSYHNLTAVASPRVESKIRYLDLNHPEDAYAIKAPYIDMIEPLHRLSPFTIYAMTEAPRQALENHPNRTNRPLHVIDGRRVGGADVQWGNARVDNQHRIVRPEGVPWVHTLRDNSMPEPGIVNARAVVKPAGMNLLRMGNHSVPGTVELEFYLPFDASIFGGTKVAYGPPRGDQSLSIGGYRFTEYGSPVVEFKNRELRAVGFNAERMGTRLVGDWPYMWQGLRVGPLMPTIPAGYRADLYGAAFVAYRVRELQVSGFDSFAIGYDINQFGERMKVARRAVEQHLARRIVTLGSDSSLFGHGDAKLLRQYIRPDGNAEQYRKGAF